MYEKSYGAEEVDTIQVTWIKVGPVLFPDGVNSDFETLLCSVGTKTSDHHMHLLAIDELRCSMLQDRKQEKH